MTSPTGRFIYSLVVGCNKTPRFFIYTSNEEDVAVFNTDTFNILVTKKYLFYYDFSNDLTLDRFYYDKWYTVHVYRNSWTEL